MGSLSKAKGLFYFHTRHGDKECMSIDELSLELKSAGTFSVDDEVGSRRPARQSPTAARHSRHGAKRRPRRAPHLPGLPGACRAMMQCAHVRQAYVPLFLTIHDSILHNPMQMQNHAK